MNGKFYLYRIRSVKLYLHRIRSVKLYRTFTVFKAEAEHERELCTRSQLERPLYTLWKYILYLPSGSIYLPSGSDPTNQIQTIFTPVPSRSRPGVARPHGERAAAPRLPHHRRRS